ncbi:MAG: diacylglycerol/lipid kinase family protein [Terriglobia bacterium]
MKVLLLANHEAAGGRARRVLPRLRDFFSRRLSAFDFCETKSADELRRFARAAAQAGYHRVLAAGGDGTANAVLNGLWGTEGVLGILPLGHGNDLARSLGVPLDPLAAAEFLLQAPPGAMDVVRAGENIYAGVAGVGFDAETNRRANRWAGGPRGHARYFLAALRTLASYQPLRVEIMTDAEAFTGPAMWVAVANTPYYGGGLRIAPQASPHDGVLDICIIEPLSAAGLLWLYPALKQGRHLRSRAVRYFRACKVEFRAPEGAELFGDGELLGRVPLKLEVEPAAVRVVRAAP